MKVFLVLALLAPLISRAQTQGRIPLVKPAVLTGQQALTGLINPRFLNVPTGRFLYRHLRDTLNNYQASPLPAGNWNLVIIRAASPHWLAVRWLPSFSQFATTDTAIYYIPRAGTQTIIQL